MKDFLKKITVWTWAFIILLTAFFTVGMCTLGDVRTTGKAFALQGGKTAYYSLTLNNNEKLDSVYVKIDNYYAAKGEDVTITLNTTSTSSPSSETSWSVSNILKQTIVHTEGGEAVTAALTQNWIALGTRLNRTARTISISANASVSIAEIVCLNADGNLMKIKGYTPSYGSDAIAAEGLAPALDAQNSFVASESAYYNFTAEESYYLNAVKNVLAGNKYVSSGRYITDGNFNYLSTVLFVPSVAIFGASVFAMRLPAFLATCALLVFAYLFVRSFARNKKYAFLFAVILCVGGMLTTVGRMAAPYAFIASALVASGYFMYKFFAKGISSDHIYKGGLNILLSGIFAAFALAIDIASVFPVAAILVLFGFGLRRQKLAYQIELKKTAGKEEQITNEQGETLTVNKAEKTVNAKFAEKQRVSWGFAILSFVMVTVVLILFAGIVCYSATIRVNSNKDSGIFIHIWKGVFGSLRSGAAVPFGEANQSNVWAWWLPIKAATIYKGVNGVASGQYVVWNVVPNLAVSGLSFAAVLGVTVKVAFDLAKGNKDKKALRLRRNYFILLSALAAAMLGGCLKLYVTPVNSLLFHIVYTAFLPLAATLIPEEGMGKAKKIILESVQWLAVAGSVLFFAITLPGGYGIVVSDSYARIMRFVCFINNGYLRSFR